MGKGNLLDVIYPQNFYAADLVPLTPRWSTLFSRDQARVEGGVFNAGGVRTTIAMHCGIKIFKMAAKVEKFRRLYALLFNRYSSFLRSFF